MRTARHDILFNRWWTLPVLILFGLLWLWMGIALAGSVQITVRPNATVDGPRVLLGDVADISTADARLQESLRAVQLTIAPTVGRTIEITGNLIRQKLHEHRIETENVILDGAAAVKVSLKTVTVSGQEFAQAAKDYLESAVNTPNGRHKITIANMPSGREVPARDMELKVAQNLSRTKGRFVIYVGVYNGERLFWRVPVQVEVKTFEPYVVASRDIGYGAIIGAEDIELIFDETTTFNNDLIDRKDLVVGKRTTVSVTEGSPVLAKYVETPPLMTRGDAVEIEVRRGRIVITCQGIAMEDGRLGDTISVKRVDNQKMLNATVVTATKVAIQ